MPFTPYSADDSLFNTEARGPIHIAPGEYQLVISDVQPSPETADKSHHRFRLIIEQGPDGVGKTITEFCHTGDKSWFRLGMILQASGITVSPELQKRLAARTYPEHVKISAMLAGNLKSRRLGGTIADETYNGQTVSRIQAFYPADEYEAKARFQVPSQPVGPVAAQDVIDDLDDLLGGAQAKL